MANHSHRRKSPEPSVIKSDPRIIDPPPPDPDAPPTHRPKRDNEQIGMVYLPDAQVLEINAIMKRTGVGWSDVIQTLLATGIVRRKAALDAADKAKNE